MSGFTMIARVLRYALGEQESTAQHTRAAQRAHDERDQARLSLEQAEAERRASNDRQDRRLQKCKLGLDLFAVIIALATLGAVGYYAHVASRQLDEMKETNRLTRVAQTKAEEAEQRASLTIADSERPWLGVATMGPVPATNDRPRVRISLINSGKTPALEVRESYIYKPVTLLPGSVREIPAPTTVHARKSVTVVLPSQITHATIAMDRPLTPDEKIAMGEKRLWLLIVGHVTYRDRLGRMHHTIICGYTDVDTLLYAACGVGNDAD